MLHYAMILAPVSSGEDTLVFALERTVTTRQLKGKSAGADVEAMFALTAEQFIEEGRLATVEDIISVHRNLHPPEQEQAS